VSGSATASATATASAFVMELRTIAGRQCGSGLTLSGYGTEADFSCHNTFRSASHCAIDPTHRTLYVSDSGWNMIRTIDLVSLKVDLLVPGLSASEQAGNIGYGLNYRTSGVNGGASDGVGSNARFDQNYGIAIDPTGALLYTADWTGGRVREIAINTTAVRTIAGFPFGGAGDPWPAIAARTRSKDAVGTNSLFANPTGLAIDGDLLFISDMTYCDIRVYTRSTGAVTTLAGGSNATPYLRDCGDTGFGGANRVADGVGTNARFDQPVGLAADGAGKVYVADYGNNRICEITISTAMVRTIVGSPARATGYLNGVGTSALLWNPYGLTYDTHMWGVPTLLIGDSYNAIVRRVDLGTLAVTTPVGTAGYMWSAQDGYGPGARFKFPVGICTSRHKAIYVMDLIEGKVRQITSSEFGYSNTPSPTQTRTPSKTPTPSATPGSNNVWVLAGANYALGCRMGDGIGTNAYFGTGCSGRPYPLIASAIVGNDLFVADGGFFTVRKMDMATLNVTSLAGCAANSYVHWPNSNDVGCDQGDADGVGSNAKFYTITGMAAVDGPPATALLISDANNNKIKKLDLATLRVTTVVSPYLRLAGDAGPALFVADRADDGVGTNAMTSYPLGMTSNLAGSVYFVDSTRRVRHIDVASFPYTVTSLAGRMPRSLSSYGVANNEPWSTRVCGGDFDGVGTNAVFGALNGVALEGTGRYLYVSDNGGSGHGGGGGACFRRVDLLTKEVKTVVGFSSSTSNWDGGPAAARLSFPANMQHYADSHGNVSPGPTGRAVAPPPAPCAPFPAPFSRANSPWQRDATT
jgi:hypothetical protein